MYAAYPQQSMDQQYMQPQYVQSVESVGIYSVDMNNANQYQPQQPQQIQPQVVNIQTGDAIAMSERENSDNNWALFLFLCGFCCTMLWIVTWVIYRRSPYKNERRYAQYSAYCIIGMFVFEAILFLLYYFTFPTDTTQE